ncbi:MAG: porin [Pseudomonadota bacterium]
MKAFIRPKTSPMLRNLITLAAICLSPLAMAGEVELWDGWELRYGGMLHTDTVSFSDDVTPLDNSTDFRRARTRLQLSKDDWRFRADYDFGIARGFRSTFVEYRGFRKQRIVVGNQVAPFSMEDLKASRSMGLVERSIASALSPGMQTGASWRTWRDNWSVHAGVFGDAMDDLDRRRLPGRSLVSRVTYAPVNQGGFTVHLGAAAEFRNVDNGERVRLRARPGSRLTDRRLVDTRSIDGVDSSNTYGLEFGLSYDRFRVQAEVIRNSLDAAGGSLNFGSQYLMASYVIGGRAYDYSHSRGNFKSVRPEASWGSVELLARVATLDLGDGLVEGGEQREITAGVSWIYNEHVRVMLSLSEIDAEPNRDGIDESVTVGSLRLQLTF